MDELRGSLRNGVGMKRRCLHGRSVLIVEDELWVALDLQDSFVEAGARVLTAFGTEQALKLAQSAQLAAAVIDMALVNEDGGVLCRRLAQRRVPFIVLNGDRMTRVLTDAAVVPLIAKLAEPGSVVEAIALELGEGAANSFGTRRYSRSGSNRRTQALDS